MKTTVRIVVTAVMVSLAWVGAGFAQEPAAQPGRNWCGPAGVWFGSNETYGLEYVVTIDKIGGGCFSVVAENIEVVPPWEYSTPWRGVIRKTGPGTYRWQQITYAGPSQLTDPGAGVPDIAAIRGEMTMLDCDHFEVDFGPTGVYAWGQTPFEDEPLATWPPSIARYTRVPFECESEPD